MRDSKSTQWTLQEQFADKNLNLQEVKDFIGTPRKVKKMEAAGIEPASADPLPLDLHA